MFPGFPQETGGCVLRIYVYCCPWRALEKAETGFPQEIKVAEILEDIAYKAPI